MADVLRNTYETNTVDCAAIANLIKEHDRFVLLMHRHPDGDTVCSATALAKILKMQGKSVRLACADPIPGYLSALCPFSVDTDGNFAQQEVLWAVDVAEASLLGTLAPAALEKGILLKLDHHRTGGNFAQYNMTDPDACAAGEIVARLADCMGTDDQEVLLSCYAAIASDTGCFRYSNTTAEAFSFAARLRKNRVSLEEINGILFENKDYPTLLATSFGIAGTRFYYDGRVALFAITRKEMDANGFSDENLSELPSALREIRGVQMSVILREQMGGGSFRLSSRSDWHADCTALCGAFGGGGHLRAAGATVMATDKEEAISMVLSALKAQFANEQRR